MSSQDVLAVHKSIAALVEAVTHKQMLLKNKLGQVLEFVPRPPAPSQPAFPVQPPPATYAPDCPPQYPPIPSPLQPHTGRGPAKKAPFCCPASGRPCCGGQAAV